MTDDTTAAASPPSMPSVLVAFDALCEAWEQLLTAVDERGLDQLDNTALLAFLQDHERFRNRAELLDHHLTAAVTDRDLAAEHCQPDTARLLAARLLISPAEARRRVSAATSVGPRQSPLGQPLEPVRPLLAAVQADGNASPEQVDIVTRALDRVDGRGFDPAAISDGETLLAEFASRFGPIDLRRLAQQVVDGIDPDGPEPDDRILERRSFELTRTGEQGWRCAGRLTTEAGVQLHAFLTAHTAPRLAVPGIPAGPGTCDERTRTQRMHDALADLTARGLREGSGIQTTAGPATVIVTIDADDLLDRTTNFVARDSSSGVGDVQPPRRPKGHALTSDGTTVSIADLALLAVEAEVIPAWLSNTGQILDLGRSRRCASRQQTLALIARDVGCSFPGCDRPPEWCERHHIVAWLDGGRTDLDNLTLLCRYHHHHFEQRGWTCRINADGVPAWSPPRWLDQARTPLVNTRITRRRIGQQH